MAVIPVKVENSKTIVGSSLTAVRQRVKRLEQVTGVDPVITGPPVINPLDGAMFSEDLYLYSDIQRECLLGDPGDVNAQLVLKEKSLTVDAQDIKVVIKDGTALSISIVARTIIITINTGTTTYTLLETALGAHTDVNANFAIIKPGTGAGYVTAQAGPLVFTVPTPAQAVQDDGGVFTFTPGPRGITLHSIALVCGAGSVVDAYI